MRDKLLNLLQLGREVRQGSVASDEARGVSHDLLLASIDQKSAELQPVPFRRAIDLGQNRRYPPLRPSADALAAGLFAHRRFVDHRLY